MFYKVKSVQPLEDMKLLIDFENGTTNEYDIKELLAKYKNFEALRDNTLFNIIKVDSHSYCIYWPNDMMPFVQNRTRRLTILQDSLELVVMNFGTMEKN